jgi:Kef-type K+ transport system membrane component KefB
MKALLIVTAVLEAGIGLTLVVSPSVPVSLLFGTALDTPTASAVGRVAGAALLSLGVACWQARNDEQSRAGKGLIAAILLYNTAAVALLAYAGLGSGLVGVGLWPVIVVHLAMGVWCIVCLRIKRS